jgi:hypothetical protein
METLYPVFRMELFTWQPGRSIFSIRWSDDGLWTVTESNSVVVQTFLVSLTLIAPNNEGRTKGFQLVVGKLLITIGWLVEENSILCRVSEGDREFSAEVRHEL